LSNVGRALLRAAVQDLAGSQLNLRRLDSSGEIAMLNYLAANQDALDQLRQRVGEHAGLKKALNYLDQVTLLAPKNAAHYQPLLEFRSFVRDREGLQRLQRQIAAAQPDVEQSTTQLLKYSRFEDDESTKQALATHLAKTEALVEAYGRGRKGPDFAAAVASLIDNKLREPDTAAIDADELVRLAEEAHQAAPSRGTYWPLTSALLFRAGRSLASAHPEYARATQRTNRVLPPSYAVVLVLARKDALGEAARHNQDVARAAEVALKRSEVFPESTSVWGWALLQATHPDRVGALAKHIAEDQVDQLERDIELRLMPLSAVEACGEYWARIAAGNPDRAREPLETLRQRGLPFPFELLAP
jgi:hypothetical protein